MRIARLSPHFYWPQLSKLGWPVKFDAIGGMQTQIYRLAKALSIKGVEQEIYTLKIPGAPTKWEMSEGLLVWGVRIPVLPIVSKVRGMVDLNLSWALGVIVRFTPRRKKFDLIHVHCSGVFWPPLLGFVLSFLTGIPLVLTVHCSILNTYHSMCWLDDILLPFARWCEKRALIHASHTIMLTELSRSKLMQLGIVGESRVSVVSDGIDVASFSVPNRIKDLTALRNELGIPEGSIVVGYVGRIAREKGWPAMIELVASLPSNFFLLICGDGNERADMEARLVAAGVNRRSHITGYIAQEHIPNYYALLNVFVLPSEHEEFGGALLEAMASGVPVAAFNVGGVPSVVNNGECGALVKPGDVGELVDAVMKIVSDSRYRDALVEKARMRVMQEYDIGAVAEKIAGIYKTVGIRRSLPSP